MSQKDELLKNQKMKIMDHQEDVLSKQHKSSSYEWRIPEILYRLYKTDWSSYQIEKLIRKIHLTTKSSKVTQKCELKLISYQSKSRFEHFSSTSLLGEELPTSKRSNDLEVTNYHRVTFGSSRPICDGRRRCRRRARLFKLSFPSSAPNLWEGHCP